jgi:molybdate transport system substrate-binding protein
MPVPWDDCLWTPDLPISPVGPFATFRGNAAISCFRSEADIERFSVCTDPVAIDLSRTLRWTWPACSVFEDIRSAASSLERPIVKIRFLVAATANLFLSYAASAAEIKVLAPGATKEVYLDLVPQFEQSSGHKVMTTWSGTADIKKRMAADEVYDVVIVGAPDIDAFIKQGKMVAGSRIDLMKSGVGVAVRAGAPKPDISSSEALKKTLLAAKSIGYSTGPSGVYVVSLIERMDIADQIKSKLKQVPSGARIGSIITSGEAEIGFQQISELIHAPGVDYVGPLPADVQKITVYSAGIHRGATQPEAAKELVKALTGPGAAPVIKNHGMEPG